MFSPYAFPAPLPSRLATADGAREVDALDIVVLEAMIVQALGPDSDALRVTRDETRGRVAVEVSPLGRATLLEMAGTQDADAVDGWMCLVAVGLVEDALGQVGGTWRPEAEIGVELAAARRAEDVPALVALSMTGQLVIDSRVSIADILEDWVTDPGLVLFV